MANQTDVPPMHLSFQLVADTVMGGRSSGVLTREIVQGRKAWRLTGRVSLDNNGGFLQMAADAALGDGAYDGIVFKAVGNSETYNIHLRTTDLTRPWQSYRQSFIAGPSWTTHRIPFADFAPHRTDVPLDLAKLRRVGIVAIGREMVVDVSVADVGFY